MATDQSQVIYLLHFKTLVFLVSWIRRDDRGFLKGENPPFFPLNGVSQAKIVQPGYKETYPSDRYIQQLFKNLIFISTGKQVLD